MRDTSKGNAVPFPFSSDVKKAFLFHKKELSAGRSLRLSNPIDSGDWLVDGGSGRGANNGKSFSVRPVGVQG